MTDRELAALLDYAADQGWRVLVDQVGCTRLVKDEAPTFTINANSELREGAARQVWSRVTQYGDADDGIAAIHAAMQRHKLSASEITEVCRWAGGMPRPSYSVKIPGDQGTVKVDVVPAPLPIISDLGTTYPYVPPFHSEWILADLEFVEKLIARGGNFRTPGREAVAQYYEVMAAGRWAWSMEPWCVSTTGHFIQGNHRAHATLRYLQEGGEPQMIEVRWDCPDLWGQLMDAGKNRTYAQRTKALGHDNYARVSSGALMVQHLADRATVGGTALPADSMLEILGSAETPTRAATLIIDGVRLADRLRHNQDTAVLAGMSPTTLGVAFSFMLADDEDHARTDIDFMIRSMQWAPDPTLPGPAALAAFLRAPRHYRGPDTTRYQRHQRTLMATMMVWADKKVTFNVLKSRLLSPDDEMMVRKMNEQWDRWKGNLQDRAISLLLDES